MNALTHLSNLPETREQQHRFADMAIEELMNGNHDLVKMWVKLSILADTLNEIKDSAVFKNAAIEEARKQTSKVNGCEVKVTERKNFDFSGCGHSRLNELKFDIEEAKKQAAEIEKFLKTVKEPIVLESTGEIILPPTSTVTSYITVK